MLARYLALILDYLLARVGLHVMDWTLRQVVEYLEGNPEVEKGCAETSIRRYMSEHDPDFEPYLWEKN